MGKVTDMIDDGSPIRSVTRMFLQSGPWAVMTLALVLGIGYEAHRLVGTAGSAVSAYVTQSSRNNEVLVELAKKGEQQREDMMQSTEVLSDALELRYKEHQAFERTLLSQTAKLDQLVTKVEEACKRAPEERQELLDAIQELRDAIEELKLTP